MCPDRSLWSAFADGEVPSPWKERMELHAAGCTRCANALAEYRALGAALRADPPAGDMRALEAACAGTARALDDRLRARAAAKGSFVRIWSGSLRVPVPVAMAAALTVIIMAGLAFGIAGAPGRRQLQATQEVLAANADALDQLVRYLDERGTGSQAVVIRLPEGSSYATTGEPVILSSPVIMTGPDGRATVGTPVTYPSSKEGGR